MKIGFTGHRRDMLLSKGKMSLEAYIIEKYTHAFQRTKIELSSLAIGKPHTKLTQIKINTNNEQTGCQSTHHKHHGYLNY